jgi:hypothetical protein
LLGLEINCKAVFGEEGCLFLPSFVTSAFASHFGHLRTSGMVAFVGFGVFLGFVFGSSN